MRTPFRHAVLILLPLCLPLASAHADVTLPALFGDHMVLQRDGAAPVWGAAAPGEQVTVTAGKAQETATAGADGKWMVRLAGLPASGQPIEVTVQGKNQIVLHDVLVGDVWVCSGQSNMEFGIKNDASATEEIAKADHPLIRLFFVPKNTLPAPAAEIAAPKEGTTEGRWLVCTPETVIQNGWGGFSAVGYFFGRDLQAFTGQPVGLIATYWGGTPAQSWTSLEALQKDPRLKSYADFGADHRANFAKNVAAYKETLIPQWQASVEKWKVDNQPAWDAYQAALQKWSDDAKAASAAGKPAPAKPKDPSPPMPRDPAANAYISTVLYNGMVAPLIPYGIKGAIWYQGESNATRPLEYGALLPAMIGDWRARWGQGDFPFLIVQLANFMARVPDPSESSWAALRESQAKTLSLPNTGLAVAVDVGEEGDIHPKDKDDVGGRLALVARKVAYGDDRAAFSGPVFKAMAVEGDKIRLAFDNVGAGLAIGTPPAHFHPGEARPDASALRGFAVAGADGKFAWATAVIDGAAVVVSSPQVPAPVAVRYAWADNPQCNFYNKDGLPAAPFRTDTYPVGEAAPKPPPKAP